MSRSGAGPESAGALLPRPTESARASGIGAHAGLLCVLFVQAASLFYFAPVWKLLQGKPLGGADYLLHSYQIDRALKAFEGSGMLWGYDPLMLAGKPSGVVEDLTSKATELFVIGLHTQGVSPATALSIFVFGVWLSVPLLGYASARLFSLSPFASVGVSLMWVVLWTFDSMLHWSWAIGMISWAFASCLSVVVLGFAHRALQRRMRWWAFPGLALSAALVSLVHPFSVISVGPAALLVYGFRFRQLSGRHHVYLLISALIAASTCLVWVGPTLRFSHYIGDIDSFFNARLDFVFWDLLEVVKDPRQTGDPVLTVFRTLCFVSAGFGLYGWFRSRDARALPLFLFIVGNFLFAYLAGHTWLGRQTQPYRQIVPAMLAAAVVLVAWAAHLWKRRRPLEGAALSLTVLALMLVTPRMVTTMLFYVPDLAPPGRRPAKVGLGVVSDDYQRVRDFLVEHHRGSGRIVIQPWPLGEYVAATTDLPVLGGIPERNVPHVDAHLFRLHPLGALGDEELRQYLSRYSVGWLVLHAAEARFVVGRPGFFKFVQAIGDLVIYQTLKAPSYFHAGQGVVSSVTMNSIRVETTSSEDLVLAFHWMESLRCRPDCRLERQTVPGDRVGFIRVVSPPPRFEIYNAYD